ncbi:MAG: VF530 family protein [Thiovulaceae bacterium]|nr:VF530 family protein [Sulfurimonadaceae bacterium]
MNEEHKNNPLHGITLQEILESLVDHYGWRELYKFVEIRCFYNDPTVSSSLKFLRKTPWARKKVEDLYIHMIKREGKG